MSGDEIVRVVGAASCLRSQMVGRVGSGPAAVVAEAEVTVDDLPAEPLPRRAVATLRCRPSALVPLPVLVALVLGAPARPANDASATRR